jgi:hypothetical protein
MKLPKNLVVQLKNLLFRAMFLSERIGVQVVPRHYYSPVADRRWLAEHPDLWQVKYELPGWRLDDQLTWLRRVCADYLNEVGGFPFIAQSERLGIPFRYGPVEGQVLHCAIRTLTPPLIVEVGSGSSTVIATEAVRMNVAEGRRGSRIVTIDPFASTEVEKLPDVEVRRIPAQAAPADLFDELGRDDLLFLDSTHVLRTGSELHRLYLEVLPHLKSGITVHIHDIYLPWMYSPRVLVEPWDWQETALLAALLIGNPDLEILCCQSALHDARSDQLRAILPDYVPRRFENGLDAGVGSHFPASTWIQTGGSGRGDSGLTRAEYGHTGREQ